MILTYTNSQGETIDFLSSKIRVKEANFSEYEWKYDSVEQQYGVNITRFTKDALQYEMSVVFKGSVAQRKENLNAFYAITEKDIIFKTQGTLKCGQDILKCFILKSSTAPEEGTSWTIKTFTVVAPYPFWIETVTKSFLPQAQESKSGDFLDFDYDFDYDFTPQSTGKEMWFVDHFAPSRFKLIVYGECVNPEITINGHLYKVFSSLGKDEYMVIESNSGGFNSPNKITKYLSNGTRENILNYRNKTESVFELIQPPYINVAWNGLFGFDLTLFIERSEPRWT